MQNTRRRRIRARKCRCCSNWFTPLPQHAKKQRYCTKPLCRRASHRASQRKWLRKNVSAHAGSANAERVRNWRIEHPRYWIRTEHRDRISIRLTVIHSTALSPQIRMRIEHLRTGALRDFRLSQRFPGQSLACQLNRALRETMAFGRRTRYSSSRKTRSARFGSLGWLSPE